MGAPAMVQIEEELKKVSELKDLVDLGRLGVESCKHQYFGHEWKEVQGVN